MNTSDIEIEFHQLDLRYENLRVRRPEREKRLLSSLAERGQQVAIVVVCLPEEPNRYLVIDGYKRIRALQRLGYDTVRVTIWDMTESEALILDRSLRTAEKETALEQGWLLAELHTSFGLSMDELAQRFDRSVSWVSRRLSLVRELPESIQQQIRFGKIGAHAAMKYLAPMARVKRCDCERLAEKIAFHQFTTQEIGVLYSFWRNQPLMREHIIDDPKLFLCARREIEEEDPISVRAGEELLRNLDIVGAIARKAAKQWRDAARSMNHLERDNARLCLQQAIDDLTQLSETMEKENGYAESESTDGNPGAAPQGDWQPSDLGSVEAIEISCQKSHSLGIKHSAANCATGKSRALPAGDSRSFCFMPGKHGAGP
jgi:ParB family transcriptional regulator, chromosome partitioning protein